MDGGAWWATVHGVTQSRTWLSDFTFTFHFHALEKEMATHSSVLAWRIPGMGEPDGLLSMGSHRVGHNWSGLAAAAAAAAAAAVIMNSLSLCLSRNVLIFPHFWRIVLPDIGFLADRFFPFRTLGKSAYCFLASQFLMRNVLIILLKFPCI